MNYWERLQFLNINSKQRQMERYRILYGWKVFQKLVPDPGLQEILHEHKGRFCAVPFTRDKKRLESFQVFGPKLFYIMPEEIQDMNCSVDNFKTCLDSFLMCIPDEPSCPGRVPGATDIIQSKPSNSLVYQVPRA